MPKVKNTKSKKEETATMPSLPGVVNEDDSKIKAAPKVKATKSKKEKDSTPGQQLTTYEKTWNERYNQLKEKKQGESIPRDSQLGSWVKSQRQLYKKNKLSPERIKLLNEIGFEWECRKVVGWNERLEELKAYKLLNGNCNISTYGKTSKNVQLGNWVENQRTAYKKGKLSSEQIESMNGIGFEWVRHKIVGWDGRFEQLKDYKKDHGDCNVPRKYKANPQLASWVNTNRTKYKNGKLSKERIESLQGIGFSWAGGVSRGRRSANEGESTARGGATSSVSWDERFQQLSEYKDQNGHCRVPAKKYEPNPQLGLWVDRQRQLFKKNKLSPEQKERLDGIGFIWVSRRGPAPAQKREDGPMPAPPQQREEEAASMAVEVPTLPPVAAESCQV